MNLPKKAFGLVAVTTVAALALSACGSSSGSSSGSASKTLTISATIPGAGWDPYKNDFGNAATAEQAPYASLMKMNDDGSVAPGLAESWSFPDSKTFELKLRANLKFADGTTLDAAAVKQNLDRVVKGDVTGSKTDQLSLVKTVTAVDATTVRLSLSAPCPALPLDFTQVMGMMVSPKALTDTKALDATPSGAGPYVMDAAKSVANSSYTFTRNPNYYDAESFPFDTLVIKVINDQTAGLNALKSGQIDMFQGNSSQVQNAKSAGLTVLDWPGDMYGLWLDDRDGKKVPALKDVKVRQAINYAVDKTAVAKANGAGRPAASIFVEGTPGYDKAQTDAYAYDPAKAKALLAESGHSSDVKFDIMSLSRWDNATQVIAANLKAVGINATIKDVEIPAYITGLATEPVLYRPYTALDSYYDAKSVLLANGGFNYFKTADPKVQQLFDQAALADSAKAGSGAPTWQALNKYVTDQAWFAQYFRDQNYVFHSKKLKVDYPQNISTVFLWNISPA